MSSLQCSAALSKSPAAKCLDARTHAACSSCCNTNSVRHMPTCTLPALAGEVRACCRALMPESTISHAADSCWTRMLLLRGAHTSELHGPTAQHATRTGTTYRWTASRVKPVTSCEEDMRDSTLGPTDHSHDWCNRWSSPTPKWTGSRPPSTCNEAAMISLTGLRKF